MGTKNYYFASANTGEGFVSYLDKICENDGKDFMYIISGGSGCGKSTMMKKIGEYFFQRGEDVEYFLCSSDPNSLDGVRIVNKNVAVVDGTAPHIINPNIVGVDSKIVDVGQFIKTDIFNKRTEIENLVLQKKKCYQNANLLLVKLKEDFDYKLKRQALKFNKQNATITAKDLYSKISTICKNGSSRSLFLNCVNDVKIDLEEQKCFKKIVFKANEYETNFILNKVSNILDKNNIKYIKIFHNINSNLIKNIIINNKILIKSNLNSNIFDKKIENLIIKEIKTAKNSHKKIEEIYIKYIDFNGVEKLTREIIEEIKQK